MIMTAIGISLFGAKIHLENKILTIIFVGIAFMAIDPFAIFTLYQMFCCLMACMFLILMNKIAPKNINFIYYCFAAVCLLESTWILVNAAGFDPYIEYLKLTSSNFARLATNGTAYVKTDQAQRIIGSMGNINHSSALVAATIPFLSMGFWLIPLAALIVAKSQMSYLTALVAVGLFVSYKYQLKKLRYAIIATVIVLAVIVFFGLNSSHFFSDSNRIKAWKALVEYYGFQIFGKGFGTVAMDFADSFKLYGEKFTYAHNEVLELYAVGGLSMVVAFILLLARALKDIGYPAITACFFALLINSLGNFAFHIAPLFITFGVCYSIQLTRSLENGTSSKR